MKLDQPIKYIFRIHKDYKVYPAGSSDVNSYKRRQTSQLKVSYYSKEIYFSKKLQWQSFTVGTSDLNLKTIS